MPRIALMVLVLGGLACRAPSSSVVTIISPAEGDTVGSSVLVRLGVAGASAVAADGSRLEGQGHHHLFVDRDPTAAGTVIPSQPGIYHVGSGADSVRIEGLAPGTHRIIAVFAYGDHVPMPSVARDTVTIVVR